jgi:hypothetical protein
MITEKRLDPVVDVIWYHQHCTMTDTVKRLGEVKGIDDDIRIGVQECRDSMEKMNQGCSGRAGGLKGELIQKCSMQCKYCKINNKI